MKWITHFFETNKHGFQENKHYFLKKKQIFSIFFVYCPESLLKIANFQSNFQGGLQVWLKLSMQTCRAGLKISMQIFKAGLKI